MESVAKVQQHVSFPLSHGAFAENILTEGICLYKLPVGTKLRIGQALAEVTQIGSSRGKAAGSLHLLLANNPIFLIAGNCDG